MNRNHVWDAAQSKLIATKLIATIETDHSHVAMAPDGGLEMVLQEKDGLRGNLPQPLCWKGYPREGLEKGGEGTHGWDYPSPSSIPGFDRGSGCVIS